MNYFKSRRFRQGTVATVFTVMVVVLVVIVNMVATALSDRYNMTLDLTEGGIFTLSQESREFLRTIDKDVNIYILNSEEEFLSRGAYFVQANEVVKRYAQQQPRISVQFVDMIKNPGFTAAYPDLTLNTGNILVESGGRSVVLTAFDLFNTEVDYNSYIPRTHITSSKAEQAMSSAILNVTSDKKVIVSVIGGHNESDVSDLTRLLQTNNYEIIHQNLMTEDINPDAAIAIMSAPSRDITEDEARKLDAFLNDNAEQEKTLFYLASSSQPAELPVLDAFLAEWGIKVGPGVVYETSQSKLFQMNIFMTIADYMENEYSKTVMEKELVPAIANSRPLEFLFEQKNSVTAVGLLEFSATSGVRPPDATENWRPENQGTSGPILALGMGQRLRYDGTTPLRSNVLVSGSDTLISEYLLGSIQIANSEYMLGLLNSLSGRDDVIFIQNKAIRSRQLPVNYGQVVGISVVLTIVFPLLILVGGVVIWLRRRHK